MNSAPASSREKRVKFIQSFGLISLRVAIMEAVSRKGVENFLTEEQLAQITSDLASNARQWNWNKIRNRKLTEAEGR